MEVSYITLEIPGHIVFLIITFIFHLTYTFCDYHLFKLKKYTCRSCKFFIVVPNDVTGRLKCVCCDEILILKKY